MKRFRKNKKGGTMTSFSSQDFKVGPCGVVFNGEILGITRNSSQVTFKKEQHTASLTTEIMAIDKALELFLDDNNCITLDMLGKKQTVKEGELLLIPISTADMTAYRFPHTVLFPICCTCTFSAIREDVMTLEFEASYVDGEEMPFEKILVDEAQRAEILPPEIDLVSLEHAMTAYIADKLGMSVNIDVFRGCPRIGTNGLSVMLKGKQPQSTLINRHYEFNVACFDNDRDKAMETIHKLDCQLPIYGESINLDEESTVMLKAVLSGDCNFDSELVNNGESKALVDMSLTVII